MSPPALYDYQDDMRRRILSFLLRFRSVMAQMPTGTGKTHVLSSVVSDVLSRTSGSVWIVAHRRELVGQITASLHSWIPSGLLSRVLAVSVQRLSSRGFSAVPDSPSLIVVDEAHHSLAPTYSEMWARYPQARFLGLTATPCRLDGRGFTGLFDTLVSSLSVAEFISQGRLSLFDYVGISPLSEDARLVDGLSRRGADGDYHPGEMRAALDNTPAMERLFDSMSRYAGGLKGIVYAIDTGHAARIADYYSSRGVLAAAIDCRTPPRERLSAISRFRSGELRVLVNVDVFSEGFDCPDAGFVQLARPTLSLSRYLQMVGRGLRVSPGKSGCVIIDNVGLYRKFGLPCDRRDWQAMFEGRVRASVPLSARRSPDMECDVRVSCGQSPLSGTGVGLVMSRERLRSLVAGLASVEASARENSLYETFTSGDGTGVRKCGRVVLAPRYSRIESLSDGHAVALCRDGSRELVRLRDGHRVLPRGFYPDVCLLGNGLARVSPGLSGGVQWLVDLENGARYPYSIGTGIRVRVLSFGSLSLLRIGSVCYTRTAERYQTVYPVSDSDIEWRGFYLSVTDPDSPCGMPVCVFPGDPERYYWLVSSLPDGSVCVADSSGRHTVVSPSGIRRPALPAEVSRLRRDSVTREAPVCTVEPVRIGSKWGLMADGRLVVPPVYRMVLAPQFGYCAMEDRPCQWGIMTQTGHIVVSPKYMRVEINADGTACLMSVPGKVETVRLAR